MSIVDLRGQILLRGLVDEDTLISHRFALTTVSVVEIRHDHHLSFRVCTTSATKLGEERKVTKDRIALICLHFSDHQRVVMDLVLMEHSCFVHG